MTEQKKMTKQDVFDRVWQAFVVDGAPPGVTSSGAGCRYRVFNDDGSIKARCAVGLCIPDELYDGEMEAMDIMDLLKRPQIRDLFDFDPRGDDHEESLLYDLQEVHDGAATSDGFQENVRQRLPVVAKDHDLTIPGEKS